MEQHAPRLLSRILDARSLRAAQVVLLAWIFLRPTPASGQPAGGAAMPWEGPLAQLIDSLTGPVAKALGIAAIVITGFGMAFSEGGSVMRKALWVVLGLAVTFSATSWALPFLGYSK
jgi:type IV secretion system protein VirB2